MTRAISLLAILTGLTAAGCRTPVRRGDTVMVSSLEYRVSGGHPAVTASLSVSDERLARVFVGTSSSLPPELLDRVGTFEAPVTEEEWSEIQRLVGEAGLIGATIEAEVTSPDPAVRALTLIHGGGETRLRLYGSEPRTEALESQLLSVMRRVVAGHPREAVEASVEIEVTDEGLAPRVTLAHRGSKALPVIFFDDDDPLFFVHLSFVFERQLATGDGKPLWLPVSTRAMSREEIRRLATAIELPRGVHAMAPGSSYTLAPAPIAIPASKEPLSVRTRIHLTLPGEGKSRMTASIDLERSPLPAP